MSKWRGCRISQSCMHLRSRHRECLEPLRRLRLAKERAEDLIALVSRVGSGYRIERNVVGGAGRHALVVGGTMRNPRILRSKRRSRGRECRQSPHPANPGDLPRSRDSTAPVLSKVRLVATKRRWRLAWRLRRSGLTTGSKRPQHKKSHETSLTPSNKHYQAAPA